VGSAVAAEKEAAVREGGWDGGQEGDEPEREGDAADGLEGAWGVEEGLEPTSNEGLRNVLIPFVWDQAGLINVLIPFI
jgi:hypothetical protein